MLASVATTPSLKRYMVEVLNLAGVSLKMRMEGSLSLSEGRASESKSPALSFLASSFFMPSVAMGMPTKP